MGLEYITQPQVFLSPISAQQGIRGLIENYPLLTTFQSWTSTTGAPTSSLQIGGFWTMLEKPSLTGEVVPESFIVTVGGVVQAPNEYRIFNYPIRKIDFTSTLPQGIEVNLTQLATHSPSSQRFNYLRADSALITNLTSTTVVFVTSFTVTENLSAFTVTDIICNTLSATNFVRGGTIHANNTILSAGINLYNLFVPVGGGTITSNNSTPALKITQTGSGDVLLVEDEASDSTPFVVNSTGRVGVGTNSPAQTFTVVTTETSGASINRVSSDTAPGSLILSKARGTPAARTSIVQNDTIGQVVFQGWDSGGSYNDGASIQAVVANTVGLSVIPTHLLFNTNVNTTKPVERMRITSSGDVGIGTQSPGAKFTVSGTISSNNVVTSLGGNSTNWNTSVDRSTVLASASSNWQSTYTTTQNTSGNWNTAFNRSTVLASASSNWIVQGGNTFGTSLSVGTNDANSLILETNNLQRVIINSSGNIGINTTNPNERLTVVGNISATGDVNVSGNIQRSGSVVPLKFATNVTGAATSYTVTHNLGTRDVIVSVYDSASPYDVILTSVAHTTTNTVTVEFDPAPGSKTYRVVVIG